MVKTRYPYLATARAGYYYLRKRDPATGKLRTLGRIKGEPGTEAFDRAYWAVRSGHRAAKTSWKALIASYRASDRFTGLALRTRQDYDRVLLYMLDKNGAKDATRLTRADVLAAMEANRHRVRFANYLAQVLRLLGEHMIDIGWLEHNPAKGVRAMKTPAEKTRAHIPWPDAAVAKFRAEAAPLPRLIFEVAIGTVQRPSDWTRLTWRDYNGDRITLRQSKTGAELEIPCTAALKAALDAAPRRGISILGDEHGRPLSYFRMAAIMRRERERLGLEAFDLHALRYRGVMELAWAGCTDDEIAAYSGHASKAMIAKYAGKARQAMRARQAREKRR